MGELRRRMEEELRLRGYSPRTVRSYTEAVYRYVRYYRKDPRELDGERVREYLVHLTEVAKRSPSTVNQAICALRFFYVEVLGREWELGFRVRRQRRTALRNVLDEGELLRLFQAAPSLKYKVLLMLLYSSGLRLSEALGLRVGDVDEVSRRIRVRAAKGGKERFTILSDQVRKVLRVYRRGIDERGWLFPGKDPRRPMASSTVQRTVRRCARRAGIDKAVTPHVLRHTFATHLVEQGANLVHIQALLGHRSVKTTTLYTHAARRGATKVRSPLDRLMTD